MLLLSTKKIFIWTLHILEVTPCVRFSSRAALSSTAAPGLSESVISLYIYIYIYLNIDIRNVGRRWHISKPSQAKERTGRLNECRIYFESWTDVKPRNDCWQASLRRWVPELPSQKSILSYLYKQEAQAPRFCTQFHDTIGRRFIDVLGCLYCWYQGCRLDHIRKTKKMKQLRHSCRWRKWRNCI